MGVANDVGDRFAGRENDRVQEAPLELASVASRLDEAARDRKHPQIAWKGERETRPIHAALRRNSHPCRRWVGGGAAMIYRSREQSATSRLDRKANGGVRNEPNATRPSPRLYDKKTFPEVRKRFAFWRRTPPIMDSTEPIGGSRPFCPLRGFVQSFRIRCPPPSPNRRGEEHVDGKGKQEGQR